ncbi:MAG: hypothetical protein KGL39_35380 [Patescibacteria group bacterium]|nr:hypothetical protein [Patescibacteria group bacterium]
MKSKTIRNLTVAAILTLGVCGCSSLDKLYSTQTFTNPATTNEVAQVTPAFTNQTAVVHPATTNTLTGEITPPTTNIVLNVTPPVTNLVQVVIPATTSTQLVPNSSVATGIQAAGAIPLPFAGVAAGLLGWLYTAYAAARNKKLASALVTGIEAGRQILQSTPEGQKLDAKVKDALIQHQELAGVLNQASALVNSLTGNTVASS